MYLDFLEIGTSNFDTLLQNAHSKKENLRGISVEPVRLYLEQLPDMPRCQKVCAALSNRDGTDVVYYVPPEIIKRYKLPEWFKGCNTIGKKHPTVMEVLPRYGQDDSIIKEETINVFDFSSWLKNMKIHGIHTLKINAAGHDCIILESYIRACKENSFLCAYLIQFESNVLTSRRDVTDTLQGLFSLGYVLISSGENTYLRLDSYPLGFSEYYLAGHPPDYDPQNLPHENNLDSALDYARKVNAGGVTWQDGTFTVRQGKEPKHLFYPNLESFLVN